MAVNQKKGSARSGYEVSPEFVIPTAKIGAGGNPAARKASVSGDVLVTPRDALSASERKSLVEALGAFVPLAIKLARDRRAAKMNALIEALVPDPLLPKRYLREAAMIAQARAAALMATDWLTAAQISELAGFSASNPSAQPNRWKSEGAIFAVRNNGTDLYPAYAIDAANGYRPLPVIKDILASFATAKDAWKTAYWFASVNSRLRGRRPQDVVQDDPDAVLAAARIEAAGVRHG